MKIAVLPGDGIGKEIVAETLKIEPVWEADKVRALMTSVTDAPQ
mgnify:CR=1 FL=1